MPHIITDAERAILISFSVFPLLSVAQVTKLQFSPGSATYASTNLHTLLLEELVQRQPLPSTIHAGSVPNIYSLAKGGRAYLRRKGYAIAYRQYPSALLGITDYEDLRHDLGVTDFLIGGWLLAKQYPDIVLAKMMHDRTLRSVMREGVIFDGWIQFLVRGYQEQCIALEYERTIKDTSAFEQKVTDLLALIEPLENGKSVYENLFGTRSLTIAYATPISTDYAYTMKQRIEHVLSDVGREYEADVFRLSYVPSGVVDPQVYSTSRWLKPFAHHMVSLVSA